MKLSQMHFRTLREVPTEAEIPSHILLLRAGMIKKVAAGIYSYMPMGWRTIRKIEQIIREEMDAKGAEEIYTQNVQPAELWKESGRWDAYGPEMWRLKDRNDREFCLGPTAEEVFTDIVKSDVSSHRQLPRMLYQITDKCCDLAATVEKAACVDAAPQEDTAMLPLEKVHTPGTKTIDEVAAFLKLDKKQTIKALLFVTYDAEGNEQGYVAVFIRGDRELNMTKLVNALDIPEYAIAFADEAKMAAATGCVGGFTGPMHLHDCRIVVDSELPGLRNLCAGACETDHHYINVNYGRDYKGDIVTDLKTLKEGDACPICGAPVRHARGVEVGQIFKLGTKYSAPMHAVYKDENQQDQLIWMGCYGIGVSRTFQAIIDMPQNHDESGIIWPMAVAPYHVIITEVKPGDEAQDAVSQKIYDALTKAGVEVIWDDRNERPGVKFKDADLIGIPVRITVGKLAGEGIVEYKRRRDADKREIGVEEAIAAAIEIVNAERTGR